MLVRHLVLVALATVEAWEASSSGGRRALPLRMPPVAASVAVDSLQDVLRAAGLDEPQVEEVWERRPPGKLPGAVRQTALLEWLQRELDGEPVLHSYLCLRKAPQLMLKAGALQQLQESLDVLREEMSQLTPRQLSFLVAHTPELLLVPASQLRENATWLGATIGLGEAARAEVLAAAPKLLVAKRAAVLKNLAWLESQLDLADVGRLQRVVCRTPLCLLLSTEKTMEARVDYFRQLGVNPELLTSLVLCTPTLLHSPLGMLSHRLAWWTDEAAVARAELPALLGRSPQLLRLGPKQCEAMVEWLLTLKLSRAEALAVLRAEPGVLEQSEEQLQLKAAFFCDVIGGSPSELATVPHVLTCNLAKHAMLRHAYCLSQGISASPTELVVKGSAIFCREVAGCDESELRAFEEEGKHLQFYSGAAL